MKKQYLSKNVAIIITSVGEKYLIDCIESIKKQNCKVGQIIVSIPNKTKVFKVPEDVILLKSKYKNQVIQRCLAKKHISKDIKLILQLDSQFILQKSSINQIINLWNVQSDKVAGIGFIPLNYSLPKINLLQKILLTNSCSIGKVLSSGHVSAWEKNTKFKKVNWLHGGCVTWRYKYCSDIFNRKYPLIKWSVAEDLIYSYRKSKKYDLFISNQVKFKTTKKNYNLSMIDSYVRGYLHAKVIKNFVIYDKNLSIISYYYSMILSSIIGVLWSIFSLDCQNLSSYLGRLIGCLSKTYSFKII